MTGETGRVTEMTISTNKWGGDGSSLHALGTGDALGSGSGEPTARPRARWSRSPNVLDRMTLRGVMVLPADGAAVVLTGTAARVWQALARPAAGDELIARLAPAQATADEVGAALDRLRVLGAVRETR
jgi:hypothetical protein